MLTRILKYQSLFSKSCQPFSAFEKLAESHEATAVCIESITGTIKGLTKTNYVVEHNPQLTAEQKKGLK